MRVTPEEMLTWCRRLLGADAPSTEWSLTDDLAAIGRLDSLSDVPSGTAVLVRGDVDAKPGAQIGQGDVRLRSMVETLRYGQQRGWVQIVFGHIGRKPEGTLRDVAARLAELLDCPVELLPDWLDPQSTTVCDSVSEKIRSAAPGTIFVLDNTRRYDIERVLWKAKAEDLEHLAAPLARLANEMADKVARIYVNEALSAGSLDSSSTIVPAAMDRVAMGAYLAREFEGPMLRCLDARLVVFSGLKIDKLDDLEAIIDRGSVQLVIAAGSLAMALLKATARLNGVDFCLGVAEDPAHAEKPYFVPSERIEQAERMVSAGRRSGVKFVLPIDFVLQDGQFAEGLNPSDQQFDVGPASSELFENEVGEFIHRAATAQPAEGEPAVAFYNGVFGMFEDPRFEAGTKRFIAQLKRMTEAGIEVYVGGGEGGKALERYGQPDWVTHEFTAGGTVLGVLGGEPVAYLTALKMAHQR